MAKGKLRHAQTARTFGISERMNGPDGYRIEMTAAEEGLRCAWFCIYDEEAEEGYQPHVTVLPWETLEVLLAARPKPKP